MNAVHPIAQPDPRFIAADVGGTHTRVGLVRAGGPGENAVAVLAHRKYVCADYPSLAAILADFIAANGGCAGVDRVAIASAGVVLDDTVINSNLPWRISLSELRRELGLHDILVINDFQAAAHAAQCMDPSDSTLLTPGVAESAPGPVLVVGPGTGLGAAVRIPHRGGTVVLPTEAGHTAFAPGNAREIDILRWLQQRSGGHVPTEQLVSGPGLVNLYDAICALDGIEPSLRAPAAITEAARRGDNAAGEAVLTFCALLGSVIGDLISVSSAKSVFIAGGLLPQLKDFLPHSTFQARLLNKGVMHAALERVPVRLIENERLGVIGAASWYLEYVQEQGGSNAAQPNGTGPRREPGAASDT
ncbi:glucokinase [Lysobacter cavernae]|uniref:Glucokinase n=1 Tax=Lysobacter cavernae TaxID=1685901 RepID=A0ABV7RTA5_9GAMM